VIRTVVALSVVLPLAATASAQQPPVFPVGLDLVKVTVTVRDSHGALVSNLTGQDFQIFEDGRPQSIQLFAPAASPEQRQELALNLGMLFDTSESMRQDLKLSQESAIRFLDAIPRARDLVLVFFDRDIRLSRYSSENQQGIFERILETHGSGETALLDAITVYISRVADTPGRKVLVLFTDGDDTTSRIPQSVVMQLVRSTEVTIYPIAFHGDQRTNSSAALRARALLHSLAEATGGRVFEPSASRELAAIYQAILDELGSQYVLGYASDNPKRDGKFRSIRVKVGQAGLRLRHRPGYLAPRAEAGRKAQAE
jgi:Ca-activated chloride channel family protein